MKSKDGFGLSKLVIVGGMWLLLGSVLAVAAGAAAPPASAGKATTTDFRKTTWGMSREAVKKTEQGEPTDEDGELIIYGDRTVFGLDCAIGYIFVNGKLVRGSYLITEEHSRKNGHIEDYEKLKGVLTEKYGPPVEDEQNWLDDLYQDDPDDWGMAVITGGLSYYATWKTERTEITLYLNGENFEARLRLDYVSNELGHLEAESEKEKAFEEL